MHTWILLRGLTREGGHWGGFVADVRQAFPDGRVLALDLPGNGLLHQVVSPTTVQQMVQACRAALTARGLQPPFHVLAMSLGAMVAAEWARSAPTEIAGCVLINTSLRPFSPFYQRLRPVNYAAVLRCAWPWSTPEATEQLVLRMTSQLAQAPQAVVADWVALRRLRPVSAVNALRQLLAAMRYHAPAAAPVRRMLLLASRQDRLVSSQCSEAIASAWGAPLRMHPLAGHDLPLDDPAWVLEQVRAWMAEVT